MLQVMELEHTPYPAGSDTREELAAAVTLARRIAEVQAARMPDVSEVKTILEEVSAVIRRAERAGVQPINPNHPGAAEVEPLPDIIGEAVQ